MLLPVWYYFFLPKQEWQEIGNAVVLLYVGAAVLIFMVTNWNSLVLQMPPYFLSIEWVLIVIMAFVLSVVTGTGIGKESAIQLSGMALLALPPFVILDLANNVKREVIKAKRESTTRRMSKR